MGDLRHINAKRDDMMRAVLDAPSEAIIVLVIDQPPYGDTRVLWHAPKVVGQRLWAWLSWIFGRMARGQLKAALTTPPTPGAS